MPEEKNPEILPPEPEFPLLEDPNGVLSLFDERLAGGGGLPILELPRIRVGAGGATVFQVETPTGEEALKSIAGVIVAYRTARVYWKSRAAGKKPPDCSSIDGFTGVGDPGGSCGLCPFSKFGSALKGDGSKSGGQACKEIRQALFLMPHQMLPHLINIPPTSIKAFDKHTMMVMSAKTHYWGAVTQMTLEKASSEEQIAYAKIVFRLLRKIPEQSLMPFKSFNDRMRKVLKPAVIDASAYEIAERDEGPANGRRQIAAPKPAPNEGPDPDNPDQIPF